jgi:hypothetical protein
MNFTRILPILLTILQISSCQEKCQKTILLRNNHSEDIMLGSLGNNGSGECILALQRLPSGQTHTFVKRKCINKADQNAVFEVYIVDPKKANPSGSFYNCDSLEYKNDILRHVKVTYGELKTMNYQVLYP